MNIKNKAMLGSTQFVGEDTGQNNERRQSQSIRSRPGLLECSIANMISNVVSKKDDVLLLKKINNEWPSRASAINLLFMQ